MRHFGDNIAEEYGRGGDDGVVVALPPNGRPTMSDVVLDESVLEMLRGLSLPGESDVLRDVLEIYQRDLPVRLERLRVAVLAADAVAIERVTHSIKGSAGNIGARHLQEACRHVEDAAREKDMTRVGVALPDLEREAARVSAAIARLLE